MASEMENEVAPPARSIRNILNRSMANKHHHNPNISCTKRNLYINNIIKELRNISSLLMCNNLNNIILF